MPIIVGLPIGSISRIAQDHPYTDRLIAEGKDIHILLGPENMDMVAHVSASVLVSNYTAVGWWALYFKGYKSDEWARNWVRLAGYVNYDAPILETPRPNWVNPVEWPDVFGSPGMLWNMKITATSPQQFKEDLRLCVDELWRYSYEVIQNTAEEYAFGVATTVFNDVSIKTYQAP